MRLYVHIYTCSLLRTTLADTVFCLTFTIRVYFRKIILCSSGRKGSMLLLMTALPRGTLIESFSTAVCSTLVSKSSILISGVTLLLFLSRTLHADKCDGSSSLQVLHIQSEDRISFKMRFCWAPLSRI